MDGLKELRLETLEKRREILCLKFAKRCLKNEKVKQIFEKTKSKHQMKKRTPRIYENKKARTKRYKQSSVPYMTKLLNDEHTKKYRSMYDLWLFQRILYMQIVFTPTFVLFSSLCKLIEKKKKKNDWNSISCVVCG